MRAFCCFAVFLLFAVSAGCGGKPCPPCIHTEPEPAGVTELAADDIIVCRAGESIQIPDRLRAKLFDTAVNTGVGRATKLLQESLNELKPEAALTVDGALGPKTRAAMCGLSEAAILAVYVERQSAFYRYLAEKSPSQTKFLKGWLRRAAWVPQ